MNWIELLRLGVDGGLALAAWNLARKVQKSLEGLSGSHAILERRVNRLESECLNSVSHSLR